MLHRFFLSPTHSNATFNSGKDENLISHIFISQVSTSTGVVSHFVNVQVVVPEAFILGSGELHVDMGSAINLVCIIEKVSALSLLLLTCVVSLRCGSHVLCVHTFSHLSYRARACARISLLMPDTTSML